MSHYFNNFRHRTRGLFKTLEHHKTSNIHYVCNALQCEVYESMGPTHEWLNVDILQFIDTSYHNYCHHTFYPSTLCNLMVDWSIQSEYGDKDTLYIAFTEHLLETHPVPPEKWGFFINDEWVHPFGDRFTIRKSISHYLSAVNIPPASYLAKYPDTSLRQHLIYQIGEHA